MYHTMFWVNYDYLRASLNFTQNQSILPHPHYYNTILVNFGHICLFGTPVIEAIVSLYFGDPSGGHN